MVSFRGHFLQWLDPVSLFVFSFVSPRLNCGCFNFLYISVLVMKSFTFFDQKKKKKALPFCLEEVKWSILCICSLSYSCLNCGLFLALVVSILLL